MATAGRDRPPVGHSDFLVTACGRRIAVRGLRLPPAGRPIRRIALDVGRDQGGEPGVWAALTADEARGLAHLLLAQATASERGTEPGSQV
ncbi:hypothetical protein [Streptomyces justiciae]|uniref:Uncharacterized protein n=1 Tax=Streptomyces justiciae TaxID=2780140 RepID=A0ABU3LKY3_9ACTN|nr:hypothetical protein [Streptomyces justiciae]MDT7839911.1 hypothetical protein [Streptomyces justiciae]